MQKAVLGWYRHAAAERGIVAEDPMNPVWIGGLRPAVDSAWLDPPEAVETGCSGPAGGLAVSMEPAGRVGSRPPVTR
jgi:hypothetical protein